jgi:glucose-6-phosphate 1-dehydrogenase
MAAAWPTAQADEMNGCLRIVDPVLKAGTPVFEYEPKTWGPPRLSG